MAMERREPCPFCGSAKVGVDGDNDFSFVACQDCCATGPTNPLPSGALADWNRRAKQAGRHV